VHRTLTADRQFGNPNVHRVQHLKTHRDQKHAAGDLEAPPVSRELLEVFEPTDGEGPDGDRNGAAERERKKQHHSKPDRPDACQ
jgi:hypothetical protein